jgi:hypothetical protein
VASKTTLSVANLEALGARRLAELLMDIADQDAATARRLRLELAAVHTPNRLAMDVRKRLAQIGRARSFADRRKVREIAIDLDAQRRAIVDRVAGVDAAEALELMWRLLDLAPAVHDRSDDSDGEIGSVFATACSDLGLLAERARPDPADLANRVFNARLDNGYGQYDGLIATLAPALGAPGLDRLKARFVELSRTPVEKPPAAERRVIAWGTAGPFYEDEMKARTQASTIQLALQEIASAQGDVDGFIAQYDERARKGPMIAAGIATRLARIRLGRCTDRGPRGTRPPRRRADRPLGVLRARAERQASAGLPREAARFRRRRGRAARPRSCRTRQEPSASIGVPGALAGAGPRGTAGDATGRRVRRRSL